MSPIAARNDRSFPSSRENRRDAARRQRWLITKQDHRSFDGRGERGEAELQ